MPYPYQPSYQPYQPYQPIQYQYQQPVHGFVYVAGIEGAKAYQMPPSSEMPLFDSTTDGVMYVKVTDAAGYPTITTVDCSPREEPATETTVTRDDLNRMYSDLHAGAAELHQRRHRQCRALPQRLRVQRGPVAVLHVPRHLQHLDDKV